MNEYGNHSAFCHGRMGDGYCHVEWWQCRSNHGATSVKDEPLAEWERELPSGNAEAVSEGFGTVHVFSAGLRERVFYDIRIDSAGVNKGILELESRNETIFHIPNVDYFTVSY